MTTPSEVAFPKVVPILGSIDLAKARQFYVDYLGLAIDWEHRFETGTPMYMQVSRDALPRVVPS